MDEIEISIERGSEPPRRPSSEMLQINPRVASGIAVVFVLALVMWLGAQTPERTPIESSTTTTLVAEATSSTLLAMTIASRPPVPKLESWLDALMASPPQSLDLLNEPLRILLSDSSSAFLVVLSPGEVAFKPLECEGQKATRFVAQLPGTLIFDTDTATCFVDLEQSQHAMLIDGVRNSYDFIASDDGSGWFCEYAPDRSRLIVRFMLSTGLGESYETPTCPELADGEQLLFLDSYNRPSLWSVGESFEIEDDNNFEACLGEGSSENFEVCLVDGGLELNDYFSETTISIQDDVVAGEFWEVIISPDSELALLQYPWRPIGEFGQLGPFLIDLDSGEVKPVIAATAPLSVVWASARQLLIYDTEGSSTFFVTSLSLIALDSAESERLLTFPKGLTYLKATILESLP